jgi:hypothetical protein
LKGSFVIIRYLFALALILMVSQSAMAQNSAAAENFVEGDFRCFIDKVAIDKVSRPNLDLKKDQWIKLRFATENDGNVNYRAALGFLDDNGQKMIYQSGPSSSTESFDLAANSDVVTSEKSIRLEGNNKEGSLYRLRNSAFETEPFATYGKCVGIKRVKAQPSKD